MGAARGRFIAFEGGEASGKSTQAARLAERRDALLTREPGGTRLGEVARGLLLDPELPDLSPRAEALLFAAARAQHVAEVIAPALAAGRDVVCDRFAASSFAYQSFGRGLPLDEVRALSSFAVDGRWPDLNVLLVVPADLADARLGERDRLERAGHAFHRRVAEGFESLAASEPDLWVRIDAAGSIDEVARLVDAAVDVRLGGPAP
ncbi:MAG: dTMP kinase [Acidimicrobiia bacterium]|nr:dTMP kinase [Acidimicrobiia bacterium]